MNFYVLQAKGQELYKIGVTSNVFERIQNLQTGSPYRLKLSYSLQTDRAFEIEQIILGDFKKFRLENEWFALPEYALRMLFSRVKEILSTDNITLRISQGIYDHKDVFSLSGIEKLCGIPRGTLQKIQPPYRNIPYKWVPIIQSKLDEIFRVLI